MVIEVPPVNLDFHKTFRDAVILFPVIESLFNGECFDFFSVSPELFAVSDRVLLSTRP